MDILGDLTETALITAVTEELRSTPATPDPLLVSDLVLHCEAVGASPADVLRRALDRVTSEKDGTPST